MRLQNLQTRSVSDRRRKSVAKVQNLFHHNYTEWSASTVSFRVVLLSRLQSTSRRSGQYTKQSVTVHAASQSAAEVRSNWLSTRRRTMPRREFSSGRVSKLLLRGARNCECAPAVGIFARSTPAVRTSSQRASKPRTQPRHETNWQSASTTNGTQGASTQA